MVKKLFFACFMLVITATSCTKDKNTGIFTASMEKKAPSNKTYIDGTIVKWEQDDKIKIFSESDICYPFQVTNIDNGVATLDLSSDVAEHPWESATGDFFALYPAATTINHNTIIIYAEEHVPTNSKGTTLNLTPMMTKTSTKSGHLVFKNLGGLIKINLTGTCSINRIDFSCDQNICGVYTTNWNSGSPTLSWTRNTNAEDRYENGTPIGAMTTNKRSIVFSDINLSSSKDFYIWLPAGTYTGAQITIHNVNGTTCTKSFFDIFGDEFIIRRNTIHPISILSLNFV